MKNTILFVAGLMISILIIGCDAIVDATEKPDTEERGVTYSFKVTDNTGVMTELYGNANVEGATILLKSNTLGTEYVKTSDSDGSFSLTGVISDTYLLSASRKLTSQEMLQLSGEGLDNFKLINTTIGNLDLRADQTSVITITMDKITTDTSPLVISEIYACGPPGAGLYYHDKYVELFNQTDSTLYLDGLLIARVYASGYLGLNFIDDPNYVHSTSIWMFPGSGNEYPIEPGEFIVCTEDAIDHRINAPESLDLSGISFEFYKDDAPDIDNPLTPNMIRIYQDSGNDWLIGGEKDALVISNAHPDSLGWEDDRMLIPYESIIDGVEFLDDPTEIDEKKLNPQIDAGATGGIEFYTGKTMERIPIQLNGRTILKDDNNSSLDFRVYEHPSPESHNEIY